jgi:steroid 5-alpha reductase family enzyme
MLILLIGVALGLVLVMSGAWLVQRLTHNAGWVDTFWTFGTGAGGVACALVPAGGTAISARQLIAGAMILLWSLRLGLHLLARTPGRPEDVRYARYRSEWGAAYERKMYWFLMIQAAAGLVLDVSVLIAARNPAPSLGWHDFAGILLLLFCVVGGGIADRQVQRFRANPANHGRVCEDGLWAWSRHPNYFFEFLGWVAYPLLAFNVHWLWGTLAWVGPALMYWLLVHVSGIPPLEREMLISRGDRFRDYQARVSAFFPRPPRHNSKRSAGE